MDVWEVTEGTNEGTVALRPFRSVEGGGTLERVHSFIEFLFRVL